MKKLSLYSEWMVEWILKNNVLSCLSDRLIIVSEMFSYVSETVIKKIIYIRNSNKAMSPRCNVQSNNKQINTYNFVKMFYKKHLVHSLASHNIAFLDNRHVR